ncbi:hypothetical protein JTE90_020122 [Oedothorax gibbosus]|uniref:Uncharacterized protein n=1 Tax=Oedothorax gibbosus TaxID=931172 RepID=A0AAV6VMY9_9ARAC|nr:hypothetical protein JTE90_020122 [Oedothorax gibbosus]
MPPAFRHSRVAANLAINRQVDGKASEATPFCHLHQANRSAVGSKRVNRRRGSLGQDGPSEACLFCGLISKKVMEIGGHWERVKRKSIVFVVLTFF